MGLNKGIRLLYLLIFLINSGLSPIITIKDAGHQVIRVFSELSLLQPLLCAALNSYQISYIDLFEQRKYLSYTLNMTIAYRSLDQISLAAVNRALDLEPNDPVAIKRKDFIVANLQ